MKIITRTLLGLSLPALLLATGSSYAAARLQNVDTSLQTSGKSTLILHFDSKIGMPKSFTMRQPAGIVLDFPDAVTAMGKRSKQLNSRSVKNIKVASGAKKLRVMVSLNKLTKYTTRIEGNNVILTFEDSQAKAPKPQLVKQNNRRVTIPKKPVAVKEVRDPNRSPGPVVKQKSVKHQSVASNYVSRPNNQAVRYKPASQKVTYKPQPNRARNLVGPVDFHRTQNGSGRAIIKLPSPATVVDSRKVGNVVLITVKNANARQPRKRIDVVDFATPASFIDIVRSGRDVQIKILAGSAFNYHALRNGSEYIVELNKVKPKVSVSPLANKKKVYRGKKLSLNFQDIEVRSVLQLLADFTDKNIVVSDSVKGNITLRMKDVPWDQALDIVLESKGLAMRNNGNVIWVAPAKELAAKEQSELQSLKRKQALEPLITEYITVNFAKAEDLGKLVQSSEGKEDGALLSKRGSISVDNRTNTILVQDLAANVNEIRSMVKTLDVPVRQVSIESRIVFATDEFGKELGARFGVTKFSSDGALSGGIGATNSMVNDLVGGTGTVAVPTVDDRLNVNMPVVGAAGQLALSLLSKDYLIDLELSALQAENKGEVISTPRVVTADKQKATIEKGVEVPYETESRSGGTTIAFKKAVLGLEVTPQITPNEHVIMDLVVRQDEINSFFQTSDGSSIPIIDTRNVTTQVLVDNGQTVVLGGVHEETNTHDVRKVPLLGDLPVIGNIFKKTAQNNKKRELLIFVTPKIMK